jgi:hypothetical protein
MMVAPITVTIPVGPFPGNTQWLDEALESVFDQTVKPQQIMIIDDMAGLPEGYHGTHVWYSPWRLGVAHAFNFGVALAQHDLVFLMGSDDTLEPTCLEKCYHEWEKNKKADAYYYCGINYIDDGTTQDLPCGYAMVTKGLWRKTGGFPVESAVGAPDSALISILMVHHKKSLVKVANGAPLVNYRRHDGSDTAGRGPWQGAILETRDVLTNTWTEPKWGRS